MTYVHTVWRRFGLVLMTIAMAPPLCASIPREWRVSRGGAERDAGLSCATPFAISAPPREISITLAATNAANEQIVRNVYDLVGNLTSREDGAGRVTDYQYDALNRRTRTLYADGSWERFGLLGDQPATPAERVKEHVVQTTAMLTLSGGIRVLGYVAENVSNFFEGASYTRAHGSSVGDILLVIPTRAKPATQEGCQTIRLLGTPI